MYALKYLGDCDVCYNGCGPLLSILQPSSCFIFRRKTAPYQGIASLLVAPTCSCKCLIGSYASVWMSHTVICWLLFYILEASPIVSVMHILLVSIGASTLAMPYSWHYGYTPWYRFGLWLPALLPHSLHAITYVERVEKTERKIGWPLTSIFIIVELYDALRPFFRAWNRLFSCFVYNWKCWQWLTTLFKLLSIVTYLTVSWPNLCE